MFNKAILIGRLTVEPELKQTSNGTYLVNFQIAVDRRFKDQNGERKADFITIVAWRERAEFVCKYFHKGDVIGIEGSIQTRNYEDQNGNKRTAVEVVADNVFFVAGSKNNRGSGVQPAAPATPAAPTAYSNGEAKEFEKMEIDNDLPF